MSLGQGNITFQPPLIGSGGGVPVAGADEGIIISSPGDMIQLGSPAQFASEAFDKRYIWFADGGGLQLDMDNGSFWKLEPAAGNSRIDATIHNAGTYAEYSVKSIEEYVYSPSAQHWIRWNLNAGDTDFRWYAEAGRGMGVHLTDNFSWGDVWFDIKFKNATEPHLWISWDDGPSEKELLNVWYGAGTSYIDLIRQSGDSAQINIWDDQFLSGYSFAVDQLGHFTFNDLATFNPIFAFDAGTNVLTLYDTTLDTFTSANEIPWFDGTKMVGDSRLKFVPGGGSVLSTVNISLTGNIVTSGIGQFAGGGTGAAATLGASTTARAHLKLVPGVAPTTLIDGQIWFDGTDLFMRVGGVTKTFTLV